MARQYAKRGPQSQTVDNAIRVLKMIANRGDEMGVTEIARELEVYPSVVSRLVATLEYHTLLRQNPQTRKYRLGVGAIELGSAALRSMELVETARPQLERLNEVTAETVFLMVLDGQEGIYIAKIDSPQRIAIQSEIGGREPLHTSSVGKALIAHLPDNELNDILNGQHFPRRTANTITDVQALKEHLKQVRENGYAIDDEEGEVGIRCIGAPIFDYRGYPVASVSVSAPTFRTPVDQLLQWKDVLFQCTDAISKQLGYNKQGSKR